MTLPHEAERLLLEVRGEVDLLLGPVVRAARHPAAMRSLLHQVGWDLDALLGVDPELLAGAVDAAAQAVRALTESLAGTEDLDHLGATARAALAALPPVVDALDGSLFSVLFADSADAAHRRSLVDALVADLTDHLLLRWLRQRAPRMLGVARLVGVVTELQVSPLYDAPVPGVAARAVRLPLRRAAINRRGLADTLVLPLATFAADLPAGSLDSPVALVAGVQLTLARRFWAVVDELLAADPGTITATADAGGIALTAPALLPTAPLPSWPALDAPDRVSIPLRAGADVPAWDVGRDTWFLRWAEPAAPATLPLVDGVLDLIDRFSRPTADGLERPGVALAIDTAAPSVELRAAIGLALTVDSGPPTEIAATIAVDAAGAGGIDVTVALEALGELRTPLLLPGLTGTTLVVDEPMLSLALRNLDTDPELGVVLQARGFGIDLPQELFRAVSRANPAAPWQLGGAARMGFTLEDAAGDPVPILDLGVGWAEQGPIVERLAFASDAARRFGVDVDALLIGPDPDHGFVIEIDHFVYDSQPGEAFRAITVAAARLHLPATLPGLPSGVELTGVIIDEAGFSGRAELVFPEPAGEHELLFGVLPIDFRSIVVELRENVPVVFALEALVQLPWFGDWVGLTIGIDDALDVVFRIESSDPDGITLTKEELLALTFRSAGITHTAATETLEISLSGGVQPLLWNSDGLQWPRLDVTDLVVVQDLSTPLQPPLLRFAEAWLDLEELATLDLFGFQFELSRLGVGYLEDTDELWVDLTGSLRLIELIPVGLGVEGFRIVWPRRIYEELQLEDGALSAQDLIDLAARIQVRFEGVYLFFGIPDAVELEGHIRFIKDPHTVGFAGDVALRVPASGLVVEAGLMAGMTFPPPPQAPFPFLYVYFGILLPVGIPLGMSGLALKGAKGLFGLNVEPDRDPDQNPYYDWYLRGPIEGAHPTNKWRDRIWSIAFGAGITITTADGKLLGVQGLLALVLPGPVIFVEGKALVFDGVFPGDGPLKAFGYFDGNELTAQLNVEATLELVEGLVDVAAGIEAFFDFRALHAWHLYLGQDQPPERRIHANVLKLPGVGWLFSGEAWLMLDMADPDTLRSRLGVHIGFAPPPVDLVVASATISAVLAGEGLLTLNPVQLAGEVALEAVLDVEAFGLVVVGVEASASVAIEGPLPLVVDANVAARVDLPVPDLDAVPVLGEWAASALDWFEENVADLPEIPPYVEIEVPLHWELDAPPAPDPLVAGVSVESAWRPGGGETALRSGVDADALDAPIVPIDARPAIRFDQHVGVADEAGPGGFAGAGVQRFRSGGLVFRPWLHRVRLWRLPLHAFDPDAADQAWELVGDTASGDPALDLRGVFRPAGSETGPDVASRRVLDLLAANPFEFLAGTVPLAVPASSPGSDLDPVAPGPTGLRWCDDRPAAERCIGAAQFAAAARRDRPTAVPAGGDRWAQELIVREVTFRADDLRLRIEGAGATLTGAGAGRGAQLRLRFPEPVRSVRLTVGAPLSGVAARRAERAAFIDDATDPSRRGRRLRVPGACALPAAVTVVQDGQTITVEAQPALTGDAAGFDCLDLTGKGGVELRRVCWTTVDEAWRAREHALECARNAALAEQASSPGAILAAGHLHKLEVDTSIELDEDASDWRTLALASLPGLEGAIAPYRLPGGAEQVDTFLFRTAGPPDDLRPYVRWSSGTADRARHLADDDIVIRFARPHIHRMFPDPDNGATGPDGSPYAIEPWIVDADGHVLDDWFVNWTDAGSATLLPAERRWYGELAIPAPPDDILELRRPLLSDGVRFTPQAWDFDRTAAVPGRRTRWTPTPEGGLRLRPGSVGIDVAVTREDVAADLRVDTHVRPDRVAGVVGLSVLHDPSGGRYELLLRLEAARAELIRVRGDRYSVLAEAPVTIAADRVALGVETVLRDGRLHLRANAGGVELAATDPSPITTRGRIGLLAGGVGAVFGPLTAGPAGRSLDTGRSYAVNLTGGEGGALLVRDDFRAAARGPGLVPGAGWVQGDDGFRGSPGAVLTYDQAVDDGEIITVLRAETGQAVAVTLRCPDARRAPDDTACYELLVRRGAHNAGLELRRRAPGWDQLLGTATVMVGAAPELAIRVRLLADRLRAWVFDRLALDLRLTGDVTRTGILAWRVVAGTPSLRCVEARAAALLTLDLTTSRYRTFEELARCAAPGPELQLPDTADALGAWFTALRASQTNYARARIRFEAVQAEHRLASAGRDEVEQRRQEMVDAGSIHDAAVFELLVALGAIDGQDAASLRPVCAVDGAPRGHLLHSVESWEPRLDTGDGAAPHAACGRTSFSYTGLSAAEARWVASTDGATLLVLAVGSATGLPVPVTAATGLRLVHLRDHGDNERSDPGYDHLHDRPYRRSGAGREPDEVELPV